MKIVNKFNIAIITLIALCWSPDAAVPTSRPRQTRSSIPANKKLDETKDLYSKTEARNSTLFSAKVQTVPQLNSYKSRMGSEAKAIVGDYEKVAENLKDISKQYDDISRLNVNEKYKEYAKVKSEEYAKRSEAVGIRKGNALAFAEIDDPKILLQKFEDNNQKSDKLFKDAEEIASKAKKIEDDNKDIFKQS